MVTEFFTRELLLLKKKNKKRQNSTVNIAVEELLLSTEIM